MRLWHYALIPVLPTNQLVGQWRECCLIAKNIAEKGSPGHLLVNKIMDYDLNEFIIYAELIRNEMDKRGFICHFNKFMQYFPDRSAIPNPENEFIFKNWHDFDYMLCCYYNLHEKYMCRGIEEIEWRRIYDFVKNAYMLNKEEL